MCVTDSRLNILLSYEKWLNANCQKFIHVLKSYLRTQHNCHRLWSTDWFYTSSPSKKSRRGLMIFILWVINDQDDETCWNPGDCVCARLAVQAITWVKLRYLVETWYTYSLAPKGRWCCRCPKNAIKPKLNKVSQLSTKLRYLMTVICCKRSQWWEVLVG